MDEQLVKHATIAFVNSTSGLWPYPRADLLDDGTFILFSVDMPQSHVRRIDDAIRLAVTESLNEIIPPHPAQFFGTWIVAFINDGTVYDAI
ncbi:hypothetical protein D0T25_27345 [Duganella sp. BJB488]|uniref:hypothetical protein n=1 Tax=unclassified Duganella TaxID=2636909 RepID=UPI000ECE70E1|nr:MULTISPECIES: hypothetical protein [unclassified Duganella]RFP14492.1 hypothetical protein D0T25_27345 [Duganella sp. BJB488]